MSSIKKLASQTAVYGLSTLFGRLINYLLVPLYIRALSVYDNGVITDFYAQVTFLLVIYTYGMETTYFRFSNKEDQSEPDIYRTSISSLLVSSTLLSAVLILFAAPIATWMMYPGHPEYIIYFALILSLDAVTAIPFVRLRQQQRPLRFVTGKLVNIVSNVSFNLFFLALCPWLAENNPDSVVLYFYNRDVGVGYVFISNLIASVVTALFLSKEFFTGWGRFRMPVLKEMFHYTFPLLFVGLAGMTNESFSRTILKYELPYSDVENVRQLGIFGNCFKLAIFMSLAIQTFRMASEPFFFSTAKNADSRKVYARIMNYFVVVCCFIFLGVTLYLDLFKLLLLPAYYEGLPVVPILLMAYLFLGIFQNLSIWFKVADKTRFGVYFTVFGAVITIGLNYALIPAMGYIGSAIATLVCYFLMAAACYLAGQKYYAVPYNLKKVFGYIFFTLILYAIGNLIRSFVFDPGTFSWFASMTMLLLLFSGVAFQLEFRQLKYVKHSDH